MIYALVKHINQFVSILQPAHDKLTMRNTIQLLPPQFTEEGNNNFLFKKNVYNPLIKYVQETAAGRRITTQEDILVFTTCADEISNLCFSKQPQIQFPEVIITTSLSANKVRNINILTL